MRDILLEKLKATYQTVSSPILAESDKKFLTESKKKFPHLNESYIIENRRVLENIQKFHVGTKAIKEAYGVNLAKALSMQKVFKAYAIAEHFARTETEETFSKKITESCKIILELEGEFNPEKTLDPNDPEVQKMARVNKAVQGKGAEDTIGPKMDMSSGADAPEVEKKKKGFLARIKEFLKKSGEIVAQVATKKETYKALAIGASMVVLGLVAASVGGWAAVGFGAVKGLLGLFSVYKGSKELISTKDFAQGKKGVAGVKEWIKNSKDPKNVAKIVIAMAKIAMGAWGASSAVGGVMKDLAVMDASKLGSVAAPTPAPSAPAPAPSAPAAAPSAPAPAPEAPAAPAAAQVAPTAAAAVAPDMTQYSSYGASRASEMQAALQNAVTSSDPKTALDGVFRPFAEKVGAAVSSGALDAEKAKAILHGFSSQMHNNNGSLPTEALFKKLLSLAKIS